MLVLKMMSGEDLSDSNTSKSFSLICCDNVFFQRVNGNAVATVYVGDDSTDWILAGNAYVMENGKTIASFAADEYSDPRD